MLTRQGIAAAVWGDCARDARSPPHRDIACARNAALSPGRQNGIATATGRGKRAAGAGHQFLLWLTLAVRHAAKNRSKPMDSTNTNSETGVVSTNWLACCPACNFDDAAYEEHVKKAGHYAGKKERYMPMLYKDRHMNAWIVECQNCGMEVIFGEDEAGTALCWNELPRRQANAEVSGRAENGEPKR